jgi:CRP-like cAMP-binding protein
MEQLLKFLNSIHPLCNELVNYLMQNLQGEAFKKKEMLLEKGRVCNNIYFIEKGLIRCFYLLNEKEVSSWFMKEGDVMISVESFFKQVPSYESIQALEDCKVYYINYNQLTYAYMKFVEFNFVGRVLTEKYYTLCEQRLYSLRMHKAAERYNDLLKNNPEIIQRVPSKHIASYLGISLETLSRVKSKY